MTKYMHHAEIYVKEGDTVEKGQQIGLSGTTGNSTGNHLHFQVEEEGKAVDPLRYLQYDEDDQEIIKMRDLEPLEPERQKEKEKQRMMAAERYRIKLPGYIGRHGTLGSGSLYSMAAERPNTKNRGIE